MEALNKMNSGFEEVELNGKTYKIGKFIGDDAVKVAFKITKLVGNLMLGGKPLQSNQEINIDENNLNSMSIDLSKLDIDDLFNITKDLFRVVITERNTILAKDMVSEFNGNFSILIPLVMEVIRVNNFLSLLEGLSHLNKLK
jgi:hypothetical protein